VATLTGQTLAAIPRMIFIFGGRGTVRPRIWPNRVARASVREIIRVGVPASLSAGINYVGIIVLTSVFARFGTAHLAAYGLGTRLDFLLFTLGYGVAAAALTLVGMAVGAGRSDLALTYVKHTMALAIGVVCVPALLVMWKPALWFGLFSDDAAIVEIGSQYLRIIGPSYMFIIGSMVLASSFQAFGRATGPMLTMFVRMSLVVTGVLLATSRWPDDARPGFMVIAAGNVLSLVMLSLLFVRSFPLWKRGTGGDLSA
jgi:Na+-driven multidrug efflux pump